MRVPKNCKVEKVAAKPKSGRPILEQPYLRIDEATREAQLLATDAFKMVCIPVSVDPSDASGPVPIEALKAARKTSGEVFVNGDARVEGGPTYPRPVISGAYPDFDSLVPDGEPVLEFAFSAKHLAALAESMGTDDVVLRVTDPLRTIVVTPRDGGLGVRGLLMPIRMAR